MDEDRKNLLVRIEIVSAYIAVVEDPEKLIRVCGGVSGDVDDARSAVATAFGVSEITAQAILAMSVSRFTPRSIRQMRNQLADLNRDLLNLDRR